MAEPKYKHLDEEKWHEVRALEKEGRRMVVREKWLEFSPKMLCLYAQWDPGMMVQRHGHNSDHVLFVVRGEMTCGDVLCSAGMHITLEKGAAFGPFVAGPQGVELFEIMMGDPRSWPDDSAGFDALLREHGVKKLPNPPIELPRGLKDTRN